MFEQKKPAPIIVRKVNKGHEGHHGGAWKVALADFAIAMMAFFLVLWLYEATSVEQKKAISGYFDDPVGFEEGGTKYVIDFGGKPPPGSAPPIEDKPKTEPEVVPVPKEEIEKTISAEDVSEIATEYERRQFEALRAQLQNRISENESLSTYRDQIVMNVTDDGLQIQIVDRENRPMFSSGSAQIKSYTNRILRELAGTLSAVPNSISIEGHTDALIFRDRENYTNWELSAERANAARRALIRGGVGDAQIAQVVGLSSSHLYDKGDPLNPINRRISILVLSNKSEADINRRAEAAADLLEEAENASETSSSPDSRSLLTPSESSPSESNPPDRTVPGTDEFFKSHSLD